MKRACVILPTYNEMDNIKILIPWIFKEADQIGTHELHVVVVDDNSPDMTQHIVKRFMQDFQNLHLIIGEKKGLGEAYLRAILYTIHTLDPDLIIEMDADLQHSPTLLPVFVRFANNGFDLVIGSRFTSGGNTPQFPLRRRFLSLLANWLIRFFGGLPRICDCTSGFRCIKTDLIKKCNLSLSFSTRGYSFLSSQLVDLVRNGARPIEIPITFPKRVSGISKLSFRDRVEFMINIFRIFLYRLRGWNKFRGSVSPKDN